MSEIRMVAVPNGTTSDGSALVRVLAVPRLDSGTLTDFGLDDWPALLASSVFELHVDEGSGTQVATSATLHSRARSEVWQALFSGDGAVIQDTGTGRAESVTINTRHDQAAQATGIYRQAAVDLVNPNAPEQTVSQRLHDWKVTAEQQPQPLSSIPQQLVSFNRVLAMVRQHPAVLEALGLVFELSVDPAELKAKGSPASGPWQGRLSLRCPEPPLSSLVTSPWTRYELANEHGFWPASGGTSTPQVAHGAIDLSKAQLIDSDQSRISDPGGTAKPWSITTIDVDGAIRALDAAKRTLSTSPSSQDVLPALRSAGLVLLRPNRQGDVNGRLAAAHRFDALARDSMEAGSADEVLSAEDLLLGYRVDVSFDKDLRWWSLCKREAAYTVNGLGIGAGGQDPAQPGSIVEEGHVSSLTAARDDNGVLHADEIVLRWTGWSLAVPSVNLLEQRDPAPPAPLPYNFTWQYRVPEQSLPPLRFAHEYRLRIRVADVTGGGLGMGAGEKTAPPSPFIQYVRHDPLQPPTLFLNEPLTLGAGVDRLVVRSDDRHGNAMVADTRQIITPFVSLQLAEQHGGLDGKSDEQSWGLAQQAMRRPARGMPGAGGTTGLPDPAADGINAFLPVQEGGSADGELINWYPPGQAAWPGAEPRSIRLSGLTAAPGAPPASLSWSEDGVLEVGLAIGREVVLELTSTLAADFLDHFAVNLWVRKDGTESEIADRVTQTQNGRNPIVSPVRLVNLVHAVRKPLVSPQWILPDSAIGRPPGTTYAELSPAFGADGLDPGSTGRLEVTAAWQEPVGPGVSGALVYGEALPAESPAGPFSLRFLHDFGDTKHRLVAYTLTAISRFRQYFDRGDEADADFQLTQVQAPAVNILSTVRPPEVTVASVVPAFAWTATAGDSRIEHTRSSWRLRLELRGSWYRTGIGERLALIIAPDGAGGESPPFSLLGRDPTTATGPAGPLLPLSWCGGTSDTVTGCTLTDQNVTADLAVYDVFADGDRYFCDIELRPPGAAPASYSPFARLSVARYQPDSLTGLKLSRPTMTDWVQILPDRHVTVDRAEHQVTVTVDGLSPASPNTVEVTLEELTADPAPGQDTDTVIAVAVGDIAQVPVWRATSGAAAAHGTVGSQITIPLTPAGRPQRLRIREMESYGGSDGTSPAAMPELTQRSAFIDVVELPGSWTASPG
jgi:hypothetical protein